MKFSLTIPTYKREQALLKALRCVLDGSRIPDEILIIDDAQIKKSTLEQIKSLVDIKKIKFVYYKKDHSKHRRGLSESKNLAIDLAENEIIFFIDDDVFVDKFYFEKIMDVWENNKDPKLFGVGGKITNNRKQSFFEKSIYNKIFALTGELSWDVNEVGYQVWDEAVVELEKAYYIHGGVSSYKRAYLKQFGFKTFSGGRTGLEDVELSLRVKKAGFYFLYEPSAQVLHLHEVNGRERPFLSGKKEMQNRKEIFNMHCSQSRRQSLVFVWASTGWILRKLLSLQFSYAAGMLAALIRFV